MTVDATSAPDCDDSLVSEGDTVWVTDRGKAKVFASELAGGVRRADVKFDRGHRIVEPLRRTGRASILKELTTVEVADCSKLTGRTRSAAGPVRWGWGAVACGHGHQVEEPATAGKKHR